MDRELNSLYIASLRTAPNQNDTQWEQQGWINQRSKCLGDIDCLQTSYQSRIERLRIQLAQNPDVDDDKIGVQSPFRNLLSPPSGFRKWRLTTYDGIPAFSDILMLVRLVAAGNMPGFMTGSPTTSLDIFNQKNALAQAMLNDEIYNSLFTKYGIAGANEFAQKRNSDRFEKEFAPKIRSLMPKPPFEFVLLKNAQFNTYDRTKGGFKINTGADFDLKSAAQYVQMGVSETFQWPEPFLKITPEAAEQLLGRLTNSRDVQLAAQLKAVNFDTGSNILTVTLKSLKVYQAGTKNVIGTIPVENDKATAAIKGVKSFSSPPVLNDILVCSALLGMDEIAGNDKIISECGDHVRSRDRRTYADSKTLSSLSPGDANTPFFARDEGGLDQENTSRFIQWGKSYFSAASTFPITYDSRSSRRSDDGITFESVRHENSAVQHLEQFLQKEHLRPDQVADYGRIGNVSVVLILPNLTSQYSVFLPNRFLNSDSDGGGDAVSSLHLDTAKLVTDGQNKNVLAIYVHPISIEVRGRDGLPLISRNLTELPVFGQSAPALTKGNDEPLALDYALIDLLTVKALGPKLPQEALAYAIVRRWQYERTSDDAIPRFFGIGDPRPEAEAAAGRSPAFIAWATTHAPTLPIQVTTSGAIEVTKADSLLRWNSLPCFSTSMAVIMTDNSQSMADGGTLAQCQRAGDSATEEQKAACETARSNIRYRSRVQQFGAQCRPIDVRLGFEDPFQAYISFDQDLPLPRITVLGGHEKIQARVALRIESIAGLAHNPRSAVLSERTPAPEAETSEVLPYSQFNVTLANVTYSDSYSKAPVALLTPIVPALPPSVTTSPAPKSPSISKPNQNGPDVVGIQLGMSFDTAEALIRDHMHVRSVIEGERNGDEQAKQGFIKPLSSGKLFVSEDGKEMIALMDEPPAVTGHVMVAWRRLYIPANTVLPAEVDADATKKYGHYSGRGSLANAGFSSWSPKGGMRCAGFYETTRFFPLADSWRTEGQPLAAIPMTNGRLNSPRIPVAFFDPMSKEFNDAKTCGPTVTINYLKTGGPSDEIDSLLEDFGPYAAAFISSRQALQSGAGSPQAHIKF